MHKSREIILILVLLAVSAVPRFSGLGKFTSIDEPFWLRASGNFYYALGQRDFQNTLYEYHPAVTTMWIISTGMLTYFPDYRKLEQGYLKPNKFDAFMVAHSKSLLQLLIVSRAVQVVIVLILLLAVYILLRLLFDSWTSLFTTALMSLSPFFLGHSRLLNHEAVLALFLLISLLGVLCYLYVRPSVCILLLSGAAAGLAQLTKSSGIVLFPVIGLAILVACWMAADRKIVRALLQAARIFGIWFAAAAAAYVIFWPGMWVDPGTMLGDVYGNALTYAFQGKRLAVAGGVDPGAFGLEKLSEGLGIYGADVIWRTTPITLLGFVAGLALALRTVLNPATRRFTLTIIYTAILGALMLLMFAIQNGPKPPHYIVTTLLGMDLIAGLAFVRLAQATIERRQQVRPVLAGAVLAGLVLLQIISASGFYPYYISYYDPLVEALQSGPQNPTLDDTGYGVGLDQAAAYLSQKPNARDITVMAANGLGSFSYYFPGRTAPMNSLVLSDPLVVTVLKGSQYVVVDYYNQMRKDQLSDLQGIQPEKVIWLNGIEFLHIYRAADFAARLQAAQP